jgi:ubiquinone/menaquinone biosynthesis C-methylase UbiE
MDARDSSRVYSTGDEIPTYLDIQAEAGITKHFGGYGATDELYARCHLAEAQEVLEVGCGVGVGPVYIAKRYACQVIAIDLSEKMLSWARKRARREGVSDRISFRQADVCHLPFEDDRFDAVIVESVLAFVADKQAALAELIRVTKPGGYIGLNESYWTEQPSAETLADSFYGTLDIVTESEWRAIWEATGLAERLVQVRPLTAKQELKDRIQWVGCRSILGTWGRVIKLLLTNPGARESLKEQLDVPAGLMALMGYALFVGRKPQAQG